jgi:hypothetical protein
MYAHFFSIFQYVRSQASVAKYMGSAFFWDITQRAVVISYRRFGTTHRYILKCQEREEGQEGLLEIEHGTRQAVPKRR